MVPVMIKLSEAVTVLDPNETIVAEAPKVIAPSIY